MGYTYLYKSELVREMELSKKQNNGLQETT